MFWGLQKFKPGSSWNFEGLRLKKKKKIHWLRASKDLTAEENVFISCYFHL